MSNEKTNNPIETLDVITKTLKNPDATPEEIRELLTQLEADITAPGYLEAAQEAEIKLIRDQVGQLKFKGKKHKQTRRQAQAIQSKLPEEVIEIDASDLEVEEEVEGEHKGEVAQEIETPTPEPDSDKKVEQENKASDKVFEEMLMDGELLAPIFIESNSEEELQKKLEELGFKIKSNHQLQKIIQETIKSEFKEVIELSEALDSGVITKIVKNEEGLRRFRALLKESLPKKQAASPAQDQKPTPKKNPPKEDETQASPPDQPKEKEATQEEIDNNLEEAALKIAPTEYKNWKKAFELLHFGRPPSEDKEKNGWIQTRKTIFKVENIEEFEAIRSTLRNIEKWRKIIDAKSAPQAIRAAFVNEEIENENLGEKLKQNKERLISKIESILARIRANKKNEPKNKTDTPTPSSAPKPKADTAPKAKEGTESNLDKALGNFAKNNPEYEALLSITNEFLKLDTKGSNALKDIKDKIQKLFKNLEMIATDGAEIPKEFLKDFFENGLKPNERILKRAVRNLKEMANLSEEEKRAFYRLLGLGKLRTKFDDLIAILDTNPNEIQDEQERRYLIDIQEEILEEFDEIYHDYPIFELKTLRLKHQQEKTNEILEKLKNLDEFILFFKEKIKPSLKKEESGTPKSEEAKKDKDTKSVKTEGVKKTTKPTTDKPKDEPKATSKLASFVKENKEKIEAKKEKNSLKLEESTEKLLTEVLISEKLISEKDPICIAINELLKGRDDVEEIKKFVLNPDTLTKEINKQTSIKIEEEMKLKKLSNYNDLAEALQEELEEINDYFKLLKNKSLSSKEKNLRPEKSERRLIIKKLINGIALMNQLEAGGTGSNSPRDVLARIVFYLHQNENGMTIDGLLSRVDQTIHEQKEKLHKGFWSKINAFGFFLKPTLKSTLRAIAQDDEFISTLGEGREEKIMELNQLFGSNYTHVKKWAKSLEGGIEKHAHTTIPRLIAYLETAIRDGKASHLFKVNDAMSLANNLKEVQREQIKKEVEKEFKEYLKEHPGENPPNKMLMYINKLNESNESMMDINKKLIERNVNKTAMLRTLGTGVAIAGTVFNPLAWWSAIPGMVGIGGFLAAHQSKKMSEDQKALVERSAIRAFAGNAIMMGGLTGTAVIGAMSLPLTIGMGALTAIGGAAGVFSPEIWKNKGAIGKWSLNKAKRGLKLAWKKAIRPTLPYTLPFAGIAAVAGLPIAVTTAALIGIPVGTYRLTKKLRS